MDDHSTTSTSLMATKNAYWDIASTTSYKRKIDERNGDWSQDFEYNAFNRVVMARIEESTDCNIQYCIDCNRQVLEECEIQAIKVTIHGPYGVHDNEFIALAEPFYCDQVRPQQIASALVGSKVPIKVYFQYTKNGKTKGMDGYILSLQDVDDDGYLVYYLRKGKLIVERMFPHDFVLSKMDEKEDPSVLKLIEDYLRQDQEEREQQHRDLSSILPTSLHSSVPSSSSMPLSLPLAEHSSGAIAPPSTPATAAAEGLLSLSAAPEDMVIHNPPPEDRIQQCCGQKELTEVINKDMVFVSIATTLSSNSTTHDSIDSV